MAGQRLRPSIKDLNDDYDQLAFPELQEGEPAVKVSRTKPPALASGCKRRLPQLRTVSEGSIIPSTAAGGPSQMKPKSRFALQREKEAADAALNSQQKFQLDLDDADSASPSPVPPSRGFIKDVIERSSDGAPLPPSFPTVQAKGFPKPVKLTAEERVALRSRPAPASYDSPPAILPSTARIPTDVSSPTKGEAGIPDMLAEISRMNQSVIDEMSEAEILEEQRSIRESLGLGDGVIRMLMERGRKGKGRASERAVDLDEGATKEETFSLPQLPAPPTSLSTSHAVLSVTSPSAFVVDTEPDEGSPEYIRRHYFPSEPASQPSLSWISPSLPSSSSAPVTIASSSTNPSFLTSGLIAPPSTHPSEAYSIPQLFSLLLSPVVNQRVVGWTICYKILSLTQKSKERNRVDKAVWKDFREGLTKRGGEALKESNWGVLREAVRCLIVVFDSEEETEGVEVEAKIEIEGKEGPTTLLEHFEEATPNPYISLARHLSASTSTSSQQHTSSIPSSTKSDILLLLILLNSSADKHATSFPSSASTPPPVSIPAFNKDLLSAILSAFVKLPWPPTPTSVESSLPSPHAIEFLSLLAKKDKKFAKDLVEVGVVEATLRFVGVKPWELEAGSGKMNSRETGYELLNATIELWTTLAKYGLATDLRIIIRNYVDDLLEALSASSFTSPAPLSSNDKIGKLKIDLISNWWHLLTTWCTIAREPSLFTNHDLVWSMISGWEVSALATFKALTSSTSTSSTASVATLDYTVAWLGGSEVNAPFRGEKERQSVRDVLDWEGFGEWWKRGVERSEWRVVEVGWRLLSRLKEGESDGMVTALMEGVMGRERRKEMVETLLEGEGEATDRALVALLLPTFDGDERFGFTARLVPKLGLGDEVLAKMLTDWILDFLASPSHQGNLTFLSTSLELPSLTATKLDFLKPFLFHSIVNSTSGVVFLPLSPIPKDIKLSTCQILPPTFRRRRLLESNWPTVVLNELLRSGNSEIIRSLPEDWDGSEVELVRTALVLSRVLLHVTRTGESGGRSALIYEMIKVFMLEKDNVELGNEGADKELFRDDTISYSMKAILDSISVGSEPGLRTPLPTVPLTTLETISSRISSAPFYSLYTDLLGLYDSISLSDPLFSRIILPPLAMTYAHDFRKLFWIDYAYLLKNITTPIEQIVLEEADLSSFLYPVEENELILSGYADNLGNGNLEKGRNLFLFWLAVHHLSTHLFNKIASKKLVGVTLKRIVKGLRQEVKEDLCRYEQSEVGETLKVGKDCFERVEVEVNERFERLAALAW